VPLNLWPVMPISMPISRNHPSTHGQLQITQCSFFLMSSIKDTYEMPAKMPRKKNYVHMKYSYKKKKHIQIKCSVLETYSSKSSLLHKYTYRKSEKQEEYSPSNASVTYYSLKSIHAIAPSLSHIF
jgi:hypothetical protein